MEKKSDIISTVASESGKKETKFLMENEEVALGEVEEVLGLLRSDEERAVRNKKIREILPTLSNDAVIMLAISEGHQLSMKEFQKRFGENSFTSIKELFLIRSLVGDGVDFKYGEKIIPELRKRILASVPYADQDEIVDVLCFYANNSLMNKGNILTAILLLRDDAEEIIAKARKIGGKGERGVNIEQSIHFIEKDYQGKINQR